MAVPALKEEVVSTPYQRKRRTSPRFTPEAYLARERQAKEKSEYFNGEIVAMAGASREHNRIVTNLVAKLDRQLENRACNVYSSDLRVKIPQTDSYSYPDVIVTCGEELFSDKHFDTLVNPIVLIEVLSDSTEAYDRGLKFTRYQQIPSLMEYVLVSQEPYQVEIYRSLSDRLWLYAEFHQPDDVIDLTSINCQLKLEDIYLKVRKKEDEEAEPEQ